MPSVPDLKDIVLRHLRSAASGVHGEGGKALIGVYVVQKMSDRVEIGIKIDHIRLDAVVQPSLAFLGLCIRLKDVLLVLHELVGCEPFTVYEGLLAVEEIGNL